MPNVEKVRTLAKDLTASYPRSPREMHGGYVMSARFADKCRAFLLGMNGKYSYWPCSLAGLLFASSGSGRNSRIWKTTSRNMCRVTARSTSISMCMIWKRSVCDGQT